MQVSRADAVAICLELEFMTAENWKPGRLTRKLRDIVGLAEKGEVELNDGRLTVLVEKMIEAEGDIVVVQRIRKEEPKQEPTEETLEEPTEESSDDLIETETAEESEEAASEEQVDCLLKIGQLVKVKAAEGGNDWQGEVSDVLNSEYVIVRDKDGKDWETEVAKCSVVKKRGRKKGSKNRAKKKSSKKAAKKPEKKEFAVDAEEEKETLEKCLEGVSKVQTRLFAMGPTLAAKLLAKNFRNRPVRRGIVKRYALDILRGKWKFNGGTILRDGDGNMLNGQHRCHAVILAEKMRAKEPERYVQYGIDGVVCVPVLMVRGIESDDSVVDTMDIGQARKAGDILFRRDEFGEEKTEREQKALSKDLAGAARLVWLRTGGRQVSDAPHFPHSEMIDFIGEHEGLKRAVEEIHRLDGGTKKCIRTFLSRPYAAGLMYLAENSEDGGLREKASEFFAALASGEDLKKDNPVLSLRETITRMKSNGGTKLTRDSLCCLVVKAWNAWIAEKDLPMDELTVAEVDLRIPPRMGGLDKDRTKEVE